jgi:dihydroorotate dehydrogenase
MALYPLLRPLAFLLDAETAHRATIAALRLMPVRRPAHFPPSLRSTVGGLDFPSPVGLAAGFDKDAQVPEQMLGLGFGFVEVGTVTPHAQPGNPKPRLFRLGEDRAVINRLGFNNRGQLAAFERLRRCGHGVIGVNIGANKDSGDWIGDYVRGIGAMAPVAAYLTVNISSPNTPGLRGMQDHGALEELLAAVKDARPASGPPLFLKVAPDLDDGDSERIVRAAIDHGLDGLVVGNTSVSRPPLKSRHARQSGGLSGAPLKPLALEMLRRFRAASGGELPLIGVGGIASAEDAWQRILAGASLVQLYSAMVYEGPGIARRIARGLAERLERAGFASIAEAVGSE